ncbi:MAG: hypothetical protein K2K31_00035, partial [Clostridia bacterium]|nr:hypothetical protein [Clostridia bacterium]
MKKDIELDRISIYSEKFRKKFDDLSVVDKPLKVQYLNKEIEQENKFEFNIELEDCKVYNQ